MTTTSFDASQPSGAPLVRVYMAGFGKLRGEILQGLLESRRVEVVGEERPSWEPVQRVARDAGIAVAEALGQLLVDVERHGPHVVLLELQDESAGDLLSELGSVRVVVVTPRGDSLGCRELCTDRRVEQGLDLRTLVDWILDPGDSTPGMDR